MNIIKYLKVAIDNLLHAKLRSVLAMLGIVVGTGAVVALMSSSQLATEHALAQFKSLGTNLLAVSLEENPVNAAQKAQAQELSMADVPKVKQASPQITELTAYANYYGGVYYKGQIQQAQVLGVDHSFPAVVHLDLASGRYISDLDGSNYYCVIGHRLANRLRTLAGGDVLQQQLQIGRYIYTIIGITKQWQSSMFLNADLNDAVMIPLKAALMLSQYTKISDILFRLQPKPNIPGVQAAITKVMSHLLPAYQLRFRNPQQVIHIMAKQRQTFSMLLIMVGSIALVVGGIGVMNIMLVSVIERKREIGIRMAIGATRSDIRWMFLLEAVALTVVGGLVGICIGTGVTWVLATWSHWSFYLEFLPIGLGFGVSTLVGIVSGIYPAISASKLNPIACLRVD